MKATHLLIISIMMLLSPLLAMRTIAPAFSISAWDEYSIKTNGYLLFHS